MRKKKRPSYEVKVSATKSVINEGKEPKDVAVAIGVHFTNIYGWVSKVKENGNYECLKRNQKGGPEKILNQSKALELLELILCPASDFGFIDDLWTTKRISIICKKKLKIKISNVSVWRVLRKNGFLYKKAVKGYTQGNEDELNSWLKNEFPEILQKMREFKGILYFLDESNIQMSSLKGKTWAPIGVTPIVRISGKRGSISAMSAISKSGYLTFTLHESRINADCVIDFLENLKEHHKRRHLFVLMDNSPVHKAKKIQLFQEKNKTIHIHYLPAYWPRYNPDEFVWNYLKNNQMKAYSAENSQKLKVFVKRNLTAMSNNFNLLQGIFMRCPLAIHMK